jgi:hypothetical protein
MAITLSWGYYTQKERRRQFGCRYFSGDQGDCCIDNVLIYRYYSHIEMRGKPMSINQAEAACEVVAEIVEDVQHRQKKHQFRVNQASVMSAVVDTVDVLDLTATHEQMVEACRVLVPHYSE